VIKEAKDLLESVVHGVLPALAPGYMVVRSKSKEEQAIMARKWPVISLITDEGTFDDREARTCRYADTEAGIWKERYVRGSRTLPLQLRCWAEGEDAADEIFSKLLPEIPRRWELDGFEGLIRIGVEAHSDNTGAVSTLYLSAALIEFSVDVAGKETIIPTIRRTEMQAGESDNAM
jgi:hypothetical protein